MTHTLHRCGTPESLRDDYPWLMYWSRGINDVDVRRKCLEIIEAAQAVGCENWGDTKAGSILARPAEEIKGDLTDRSRVRGVFTSKQQLTEFLRILKEKDLGMSVIISGLLEDVLDACRQAGVTPHTINFSLGVWGKKELLPPEEVLEDHHHVRSSHDLQRPCRKARLRYPPGENHAPTCCLAMRPPVSMWSLQPHQGGETIRTDGWESSSWRRAYHREVGRLRLGNPNQGGESDASENSSGSHRGDACHGCGPYLGPAVLPHQAH